MNRGNPKISDRPGLLEVIVCSVDDALEAERGGAGRLEVVRNLELGGFTPNLETVQEIRQCVSIPVRVMLRCRESHTATPSELGSLCDEAELLAALGIDGLVLGFLDQGQVDLEATRQVLSRASNLKATFHRAFDETARPLAEIDRLKELRQVDRILSSGGSGSWETRVQRLKRYQQAAGPEITVLVCGGLDRMGIEHLVSETRLREFHTGRAVRVPREAGGVVQAELVEELVTCLQR